MVKLYGDNVAPRCSLRHYSSALGAASGSLPSLSFPARKEIWRHPVSDRIHELLHRNLQEVFGEGDASRRRAAIEELYTDDCVLYVPPGVFVGHDALEKFAGDLRATHPHFVYTPHGAPQALHNAGRLAWGSGPRGEKPDYTGLDVIIVRDDKIAALYVFLDSMPS